MTGINYIDVSDRTLLLLEGTDGLDLLQRISTNDVSKLKEGEHAQTVLTTDKGRIVDVVTVFRLSGTSLLVSGNSLKRVGLSNWVSRFVVMEDVKLSEAGGDWKQTLMFGAREEDLVSLDHSLQQSSINLIHQDKNFLLICTRQSENIDIDKLLQAAGTHKVTMEEYERFRVRNALPGYPGEINEQFNPLELGLRSLVSFSKGCYVGQEVIARLDTYQKVNKQFLRLRLNGEPARVPTDLLTSEGEKKGVLTSFIPSDVIDGGILALGVVVSQELTSRLSYTTANGAMGTAVPV